MSRVSRISVTESWYTLRRTKFQTGTARYYYLGGVMP
jgi:hypothetical protein